MIPISICIIAKNEEKHLIPFLSSIEKHFKNYPHEIVIVDTGSTDQTIKIAQKYTSKIFHFEWIDDFSAARNYSLACASFQWVLVLDCDEYILSLDLSVIQQVMRNDVKAVGLITCKNHSWSNGADKILTNELNRLFNKRFYHYEDIIHEQLIANNKQAYSMISIPLVVDHYGYAGTKEELINKANRNNKLLFHQLQQDPTDSYIYYQLGQSFYMIDDNENARLYIEKGLSFVTDTRLEYVQRMINIYGNVMLNLGFQKEILAFLEKHYEAYANSAEFACLMGNVYFQNQMYLKSMQEYLKATSYAYCDTEGSNSFIPLFCMGYINELLGEIASAKKLYENCGNYAPAVERLKKLS